MLLFRTLRDMNLSKLVAQDVPLFLSMLSDLFPAVASPPKREYPAMEAAIRAAAAEARLVPHADWLTKVVQLYETMLVRHGIMLVGAAAGGKSRIVEVLQAANQAQDGRAIKLLRVNPKAIQAHEMYGQTDASGEWVKGVFAVLWEKYNNRELPYNSWVMLDGPVDAIWIEDRECAARGSGGGGAHQAACALPPLCSARAHSAEPPPHHRLSPSPPLQSTRCSTTTSCSRWPRATAFR